MTVSLEIDGAVAVVLIDRPPVNALDTATYRELDACLSQVIADSPMYGALVLAARGARAFSAGADIKEFESFLTPAQGLEMAMRIHEIQNRLEGFGGVSIAAVEAPALGGGCELILACDLRVAGEGATFGFPEVRVGQFPGTGGTMRLPWLIGESRAREMLLTGGAISAARALEFGLVHRVVSPGQALGVATDWAQQLATLPRAGVSAAKRSVVGGRTGDAESRSRADADLSGQVFGGPEAQEGYRAFVDKRDPDYAAARQKGS